MPNIQSAKKRVRQTKKKYELNRKKKSTVRTYEKKFRERLKSNNIEEAEKILSMYFTSIDKAAKTNIFHKNTASRKKSRLAKLLLKTKKAS